MEAVSSLRDWCGNAGLRLLRLDFFFFRDLFPSASSALGSTFGVILHALEVL